MHSRYYGAVVALFALPGLSLAQTAKPTADPTLPDVGAIFKEGEELRAKDQYLEAAARYRLVTPGDSSYTAAQSKLALSLLGAQKYDEAIAAAQRALAAEPFDAHTLNILASAQEGAKQLDAAGQTYAKALKLYPYSAALWLDRGISEYNQEHPAAALTYLQHALALRPGHGTPHRLLGVLAARQGQPAHALISLLTYLAIEPEGERSQNVLVLVEKLSSGQPIVDDKEKLAPVAPNAAFEELDQLITSKVALNKDYATKVKFDAALVQQTQLLVEKFPTEADPVTDFWVRAYAPLVQVLRQQDNLTTFTYLILLSASDTRAQQWVKSNKSRVEKLTEALSAPLLAIRSQQALPDGQLAAAWYKGPRIQGLGPGTREADGGITPTAGPWLLLGESGEIKERGSFAGPGKRGGLWQTLRPDGTVEAEETYGRAGAALGELDGPMRTFYPTGQLRNEAVYKAGKLEGAAKSYTVTGKVSETRQFTNNDYEGEVVTFFPDGTPRVRSQMHADKKDGSVTRYYPNGALEMRHLYAADKLQGPFEVFYPNKVLEKKGTYRNDELDGPYVLNHPNGQLRETGSFTNGKRTGLWREYYASGKLSVEHTYDEAGKEHGAYHDYDTQGRHFADTYYDHGRLTRLVYLDAAGKTTTDVTLKKTRQPVKAYDLEGRLRSTGFVENGQLVGEWRRFYVDGSLQEVARYDAAGTQTGPSELYYANGQLQQRSNYGPTGSREGYFEQFYSDGQLRQTGFYHAGEPQGGWKAYAVNGRLTQEMEYNAGQLNGPMRSYEAAGHPTSESTYAYGKLRGVVSYDSTGRVAERHDLPASATELLRHFPGSPAPAAGVLSRASLANGDYEGPMTWLYPGGQPEVTMLMHGGKRYGPYRAQHANGQTSQEGEYLNGERYGQFSSYYADGTLSSRGRYLANEQVGEWTFNFPNGKIERVATYNDEGELDGPTRYYNPAGELMLEQHYAGGRLVGWLAPGAAAGTAPQELPPAGGPVQAAFANGKPAASLAYAHGYPSAPAVYYYSSGQVFRRINYLKGVHSGALVSYWPNGKLMEEENYAHGELHGRCRYYRPDGTLERQETYYAGERRGPTTHYDAQGKVLRTEAYWDNAFYAGK